MSAQRFWLEGARAPASVLGGAAPAANAEGLATFDLLVDAGKIAALGAGLAAQDLESPRLALGGAIVLPGFVDAHTHLDKGHTWPRAENVRRNFDDALASVKDDRERHWSAADVAARMEFALQCAYAHGTVALRTHIDSLGKQTGISWPLFAEARARWAGRIALQASPLFGIDALAVPGHLADIERNVEAHGSGVLGAVTFMVPELRASLDALFKLAMRKGWDLDFHADETNDPNEQTLVAIAETALRLRFEGKTLVGHCCSLTRQDPETRKRVIGKVAQARISVVSLPMCNMFLQDRGAGRTPEWRGITALHEFRSAGVNALIASDNTRDPFYAYGDLDMLEIWREGVRIGHLDAPFNEWAPSVFSRPAAAMGIDAGVLKVGAPADLIVTKARNHTELFSRPHNDRRVMRGGAFIDAKPPDYAMLDGLEGLRP